MASSKRIREGLVEKMSSCPEEPKYRSGQLIVRKDWGCAVVGFKALTQAGAGVLHNSGVIAYHVLRPNEIMLVLEHTAIAVVPAVEWIKSYWVHILLGDEKYFIPGYETMSL